MTFTASISAQSIKSPARITPEQTGRGRQWRVITDPSAGQPFLGRCFRGSDLRHGGGFDSGTFFEHIRTGEQKQVQYRTTVTIKPGRPPAKKKGQNA